MIKKLSNEKVKKILEFVLLPIILCLIVVSGIFFSDAKTSSSRQNNNADVSQTSPANATVHADLGSNEAVLLKNWQSKLASLIYDEYRSDKPSFSGISSYSFTEVIVTKNASYLPSETELNVTSNPGNQSGLRFARGFSICATDETGATYSDSGDITAYITGTMPYITYDEEGHVTRSVSRSINAKVVIYSEKNILAPIDSSNLFIGESDGYYSSTRRKTSIILENFSTRNVTNMSGMFRYYGNTSNTSVLDLSNCDFTTSNVTNMSYMFANTRLKTAGVGGSYSLNFGNNFSTLKVENMSYMFAGYGLHYSSSYNYTNPIFTTIDLSFNKFTTTSVTNMQNMFFSCTSLTTLSFATTFNTSNVTNMSSMFKYCTALTTLDLSQATFNTSKVTTMANMFEYSGFRTFGVGSQYDLNFGNFWNISSVTNFAYMFSGDTYYTTTDGMGSGINYLQQIDLSGWTTPREEVEGLSVNCNYMFFRCGNATKINFSSNDGNNNNDNFFADNITNMSYMFWGCTKLTDLYFGVNFQPKNVTNFTYMCYNCISLVGVDFTYFYTQKATNMSFMFYNCYNLTSLDLRAFNTAKVTTFQSMFAIESTKTSRLASLTLNFNTTSALNMRSMFEYCSGLTSLELSSFNTSTVTDMYHMFYNCRGFSSVGSNNLNQSFALNLGNNFYTNNVTNMYQMFYNCEGATKFDISIFDTGRVTTMYQMFYNCSLAKTIVMSPKFTTSNISGTQLHEIFRNCNSLEILDLSSFDTSRLSTGEYFFYNCARLRHLTFGPSFTMENATTLTHMFDSCDSLQEIDITMFNTARVTDMSYMFSGCASLTELNLSSFDTSNVTTMWNMFSRCPGLTSVGVSTSAIQYSLNLGTNFDTSNVTDMSGMFAYCSGITEIHLGDKFNTGNVTNMGSMFFSCSALREATVINTFDITKVKDLSSLFGFCASLTEIDLSRFVINPGVVIVGIVDACTSLERIHCPTINHEKLSAELPTIYKANTTTYRQISQETNRKVLDRAGNFIYTSFRVILGEELCQKIATITITSKLSQSVITRGKFVNADQMEMASIGGVFSVGTANTLGTLYSNTSLLKAYMLKSDYVDENGDMMYDCVIYSRDMIVYAPENSEYLFAGNDGYNSYFTRLRNVYLDGFDTSNAKSFKGMFANCEELRYLDISGLKNSLVENYDNMLLNCRKLVYIYTFNSNDYEIELPGAYFLKNSTSTDEIRTFPVRATELSKRFSMVLDISTAENFVAEGWTVTNGGTTAEKVFSYGAAVGALPTLRHGDRVFNGWGTIEDDVFVPYNFDPTKIYEVNEDIVLVPSWAQVYVTFDFRDGYVDVAHVLHATETEEKEYISELNQTTVTAEHAVFVEKEIPAGWTSKFDGTKILMYAGDAFGDFPSVLKDDYELLGWKTIDGEFALSNLSVPVDETAEPGQIGEVVLYADWIFAENPERWRFITFDANGGRIDAYRSVYVSTTVISEYDEELGDYKSVTKLVLDVENSNPQWDISGSRSQTTKKYYVGRLYDIMPYSVNSGYRFAGWWTQRDGGQLLESTASISDTATVYAHWEQIDENYTLNQQTLVIIAVIVGIVVLGAIVLFLIKKSFVGARKVITINEKFIENFNKENVKLTSENVDKNGLQNNSDASKEVNNPDNKKVDDENKG